MRQAHTLDVDVRQRLGVGDDLPNVFPVSCSCGVHLGTWSSRADAQAAWYAHLRDPNPTPRKSHREREPEDRPEWTDEPRVRRRVADARR